MSWTRCNDKIDFHSLIAIDGIGETATWTAIKDSLGKKPETVLQGPVTGGKGWDLVAAI